MSFQQLNNEGIKKIKFNNILVFFIMAIVLLVVIYPLIFMLMTSLKTNDEVIRHPFLFTSINFTNYVEAWVKGHVGTYFVNSAIVTIATLALQLVVILPAGYAFGKLKPFGSKVLFAAYLSTMFVTSEMTTVPVFILFKNLGLLDTRMGLIIPYTSAGMVFGIYFMTNFVKTLPIEIDESATIDGAGIFDIMLKVDLPLIKPVIATILVLNFHAVWGEFFWALISISTDSIKTLPLGLITFNSAFGSNYPVLTAGLVILTAPVVIFYFYASKYFIEGMTIGAIKG